MKRSSWPDQHAVYANSIGGEMNDPKALRGVVLGRLIPSIRPHTVLKINLAADAVEVEAPGVSRFRASVECRLGEGAEGDRELRHE